MIKGLISGVRVREGDAVEADAVLDVTEGWPRRATPTTRGFKREEFK
jgi:hypothetical protein